MRPVSMVSGRASYDLYVVFTFTLARQPSIEARPQVYDIDATIVCGAGRVRDGGCLHTPFGLDS